MPDSCPILDNPRPGRAIPKDCARPDRHFAIAARNVQYIDRLAESGNPAAQRTDQALARGNASAEMRRAAGKVDLVKIIRLNPHCDETAEKDLKHGRIVVDAAQ